MAVCFMRQSYFEETPLLFISTWDGDLFSMAQFNRALDVAEQQDMSELAKDYRNALESYLEQQGVTQMRMAGAAGWFQGNVNDTLARMFRKDASDRYVSCPSTTGMKRFLEGLEGFKDD